MMETQRSEGGFSISPRERRTLCLIVHADGSWLGFCSKRLFERDSAFSVA